ncbi:MAG: universal stress protein [Marinifilaceae bacterium]
MKRILVPVDFSGDSMNALEHGLELANELGANLRMIHVKKTENFVIPYRFEGMEDRIIHTVQEYFEKLIERLGDKYQVEGGVFDFKIRQGSVFREIVNQAKYGDAFLIVMGSHGASGFEEFFIGSNAFKTVSNSTCPVLTLRHEFNRHQLKKLVMPIDASSETRKKIPVVAEIAAACKAEVHILGVHETSDEDVVSRIKSYMEQAELYLQNEEVACVKELRKGSNNTETAIKYAQSVNADLITIMTEQTQSSLNLFIGSYAQQMVNHSPIPVLSVPN